MFGFSAREYRFVHKNVVYRVIRLDEFYEYISAKSFAGSKRGGSLGIESRTE